MTDKRTYYRNRVIALLKIIGIQTSLKRGYHSLTDRQTSNTYREATLLKKIRGYPNFFYNRIIKTNRQTDI